MAMGSCAPPYDWAASVGFDLFGALRPQGRQGRGKREDAAVCRYAAARTQTAASGLDCLPRPYGLPDGLLAQPAHEEAEEIAEGRNPSLRAFDNNAAWRKPRGVRSLKRHFLCRVSSSEVANKRPTIFAHAIFESQ
jgi:hypothetical protein